MEIDLDDLFGNSNFVEQVAIALIHQNKGDCHARDTARVIVQAGLIDEFFTRYTALTGKTAFDL